MNKNFKKLDITDISARLVQPSDSMESACSLAFQQAALHAENPAWLPSIDTAHADQRMAKALKEDRLMAGLLTPEGQSPAGLVLMSSLSAKISNVSYTGLQMDDVVVDQAQRGRNIGQYAISYAAYLSAERKGYFLGWECEEGNSAQRVYELVGAERRAEKPFRLTRDDLSKIKRDQDQYSVSLIRVERIADIFNPCAVIGEFPPSTAYPASISNRYYAALKNSKGQSQAGCFISQRVSVLRMLGYKPDGVHEESPTGYQIENIDFLKEISLQKKVEYATKLIDQAAVILRQGDKGCDFIDIVGHPKDDMMRGVIEYYGAGVTSYTGSPSLLWTLQGDNFKKAAAIGAQLKQG